MAFYGNTPVPSLLQSAVVSIDGGRPYNITYGTTPAPAFVQWYQSPTLPSGNHTINISQLDGTAVDYAVVTVGQDTPLTGKRVIVDDDSPAIVYNGAWRRDMDPFNAGTLPDGYPYRNSTHQSTTVGDSAVLRFSGKHSY